MTESKIMDCNASSPSVAVSECFLDVEGEQVFVRLCNPVNEQSELSSVLLFHDSLGSVDLWRDFPERLAVATGRQVIAYDRLGFGRSSALRSLPHLDFIAAEALEIVPELLRQLGLKQVVLCGHSVGGGMAIETAAHHPERVTALITIAAQAFVEDKTRAGIIEAKAAFADPAVLRRLEKYHGDKARSVVQAWTEVWLDPDFADWNVDSAVAVMTAPTLAIHGERDEYGSSEHPQRIARHTNGRVKILPGVGHVPHRESPDLLLEVVRDFLLTI
jgi:pimeloyl-ACP methyl ester carboxylesterase